MSSDLRLALRFGPLDSRRPGEAVLFDGAVPPDPPSFHLRLRWAGHAAGCACCTPRSEAALALSAVFRAWATGQGFRDVLAVVSPPAEQAVRTALATDLLAPSRFRLAEEDVG